MSKFEELCDINVNQKTQNKGNLAYLSWAWAWQTFKRHCPDAKYEIVKNEYGKPYYQDEAGAMVYTKVTVGDETHEMWLPVMDYKNKAVKNPDMFQVNKAIMRCLTKNLAMFGLGLYIYAGEDLPDTDPAVSEEKKKSELDEQWPIDDRRQVVADIIERLSKAKTDDDIKRIWNTLGRKNVKNLERLDNNDLADEITEAVVHYRGELKNEQV